jgi:hypothetical protein
VPAPQSNRNSVAIISSFCVVDAAPSTVVVADEINTPSAVGGADIARSARAYVCLSVGKQS